jgi:hypothetical protein
MNQVLRISLLKDVNSRHYIVERSLDYQQLLGLQCRQAAQKKLLAQPKPQQLTKRSCTLGFLTTSTFVRFGTLFYHTNFLRLDLSC